MDEKKEMTALLSASAGLLAAAAWAAGLAEHPCLVFTRDGDMLHIAGTGGYVAVEGDVPAVFDGWPDGEGCAVHDFLVMKFLAGTVDAVAAPWSVPVADGLCLVSLGGRDAFNVTAFQDVTFSPPWRVPVEDLAVCPAESAPMAFGMLDAALGAMRRASRFGTWRMALYGEGETACFALADDQPAEDEDDTFDVTVTRGALTADMRRATARNVRVWLISNKEGR